ncbi:tandem-95 repeat protein [bacterium]|nr:tandem-95 repeat protein [bacterium]MBU1994458.1 tandem-95 repeat protein [bacterium]
MKKVILKTSMFSLAVAIVLGTTGCSGGGESSDGAANPAVTTLSSGGAVDGYLQSATVFVDTSAEGEHNDTEHSVITNADGDFELLGTISDGTKIYAYGGIDKSTGLAFEGKLSAVYDATRQPVILSPLTTYITALVDSDISFEEATNLVAANLGISAADVSKDPMSVPALFMAAQKVQKTVEVIATAKGSTDFNKAYKEVFGSLAKDVKANPSADFNATRLVLQVQTDGGAIDGGVATSISTFLDTYTQTVDTMTALGVTVGDLDTYGGILNAYTEVVEGALDANDTALITTTQNTLETMDVNTTINEVADGTYTDLLLSALAQVESALDHNISYLGSNSANNNITANLVLTAVNAAPFDTNDLNLTWSSSNSAIDASSGARNASDTVDIAVQLKARVNNSLATNNRKFDLIVKRNEYAPIAVDTNITIDEDASASAITLNYSDTNTNDVLTLTAYTNAAHGAVVLAGNVISYKPNANFSGADTFTYTVRDNTGLSTTGTVNVTVKSINDVPIAGTTTPLTTVLEDAIYTFTAQATDADTDAVLTYSLVNNPVWMDINASTGVVSGFPANKDVGTTVGVEVFVTDAIAPAVFLAIFDVSVINTNDAPIAGIFTPLATIAEDAAYSFMAVATDVDAGAVLTYSLANNPAWMHIDSGSGAVSGTPLNEDVGTAVGVEVLVTDGIIASPLVLATFDVSITNTNDVPTAQDSSIGTLKNTLYAGTLSATDVDAGDTLTYTIANQTNVNGTLTITNPATGAFTYNPTTDYLGEGNFTFTVRDASNAVSNTATITINVVDAIINIVANNDTSTIAEDTNVTIDVLSNDISTFEIDTTPASGTIVSAVSAPAHGSVTITAGGLLYVPEANYNGSDTFTYTAQTLSGNEANATVLVTVTPVNDTLVWNTAATLGAVDEDFAPLSVTLDATDVDGAVTYALVGTTGIVSANVTGASLTISAVANASGNESITVSATQGTQTVNLSIALSVNAVNDAPIAVADSFTALLNTTNADGWDILANDSDVDGSLSIASCETTTANAGALTYTSSEVTSYTPANEFIGTDTFSCTVTDGELNATALVSVLVSGNHAPVAMGGTLTMVVGETITGQVMASDVDVNDTLTYSVVFESSNLANLQGSSLSSSGAYSITASTIGEGKIVVKVTDSANPAMSDEADFYIHIVSAETNDNNPYSYSEGDKIDKAMFDAYVNLQAIPEDTKLYDFWGTQTDENNVTTLESGYMEFISSGFRFFITDDNETDYAYEAGLTDGATSISMGTFYDAQANVADVKLLNIYDAAAISADLNITLPEGAVAYEMAMLMKSERYKFNDVVKDWRTGTVLTYDSLVAFVENNGVVSGNNTNYKRLLIFDNNQNFSSASGNIIEVDMTNVYENQGEPFVVNPNAGTWDIVRHETVDGNNSDIVRVTVSASGYDDMIFVLDSFGIEGNATNVVWRGDYQATDTGSINTYFNDIAARAIENMFNSVPTLSIDLNNLAGITIYDVYDVTVDDSETSTCRKHIVKGEFGEANTLLVTRITVEPNEITSLTYTVDANSMLTYEDGVLSGTTTYQDATDEPYFMTGNWVSGDTNETDSTNKYFTTLTAAQNYAQCNIGSATPNDSPVVGAWLLDGYMDIVLVVVDNAHYFMMQKDVGEGGIAGGIEVGTYTLENNTTLFGFTPDINTNAGDTAQGITLTYNSTSDTISVPEFTNPMTRAAEADLPWTGAWFGEDGGITRALLLSGDGKYMVADIDFANKTIHDISLTSNNELVNAFEIGTYNASTEINTLTVNLTANASYDFNGNAGFNPSQTLSFDITNYPIVKQSNGVDFKKILPNGPFSVNNE